MLFKNCILINSWAKKKKKRDLTGTGRIFWLLYLFWQVSLRKKMVFENVGQIWWLISTKNHFGSAGKAYFDILETGSDLLGGIQKRKGSFVPLAKWRWRKPGFNSPFCLVWKKPCSETYDECLKHWAMELGFPSCPQKYFITIQYGIASKWRLAETSPEYPEACWLTERCWYREMQHLVQIAAVDIRS